MPFIAFNLTSFIICGLSFLVFQTYWICTSLLNDLHRKKKNTGQFRIPLLTVNNYGWSELIRTLQLAIYQVDICFYGIFICCSTTLLLKFDTSAYFNCNKYLCFIYTRLRNLFVIFTTAMANDYLYWMCNGYYLNWYEIFILLIYDHFEKKKKYIKWCSR